MSGATRVLIATDLDGTLVPNDARTLPPFTASILRRLDAAGVPVVFVTARPLRWMDAFWPHVGGHGMAIVSNGAVTYDAQRARIVSMSGINPDTGLQICDSITRVLPGARFAIECVDGIRLDPEYVEPYPSDDAPRGPLTELWTEPAVKLLVRHPDADADLLHHQVAAIVGASATATWSVAGLVEISAAGVTKASALQDLCERLGYSAADVIAFGDMPNDIPMLTWAGTSYAVENAHDSVRQIAQYSALGCADEGVAQVLQRLLDA